MYVYDLRAGDDPERWRADIKDRLATLRAGGTPAAVGPWRGPMKLPSERHGSTLDAIRRQYGDAGDAMIAGMRERRRARKMDVLPRQLRGEMRRARAGMPPQAVVAAKGARDVREGTPLSQDMQAAMFGGNAPFHLAGQSYAQAMAGLPEQALPGALGQPPWLGGSAKPQTVPREIIDEIKDASGGDSRVFASKLRAHMPSLPPEEALRIAREEYATKTKSSTSDWWQEGVRGGLRYLIPTRGNEPWKQ